MFTAFRLNSGPIQQPGDNSASNALVLTTAPLDEEGQQQLSTVSPDSLALVGLQTADAKLKAKINSEGLVNPMNGVHFLGIAGGVATGVMTGPSDSIYQNPVLAISGIMLAFNTTAQAYQIYKDWDRLKNLRDKFIDAIYSGGIVTKVESSRSLDLPNNSAMSVKEELQLGNAITFITKAGDNAFTFTLNPDGMLSSHRTSNLAGMVLSAVSGAAYLVTNNLDSTSASVAPPITLTLSNMPYASMLQWFQRICCQRESELFSAAMGIVNELYSGLNLARVPQPLFDFINGFLKPEETQHNNTVLRVCIEQAKAAELAEAEREKAMVVAALQDSQAMSQQLEEAIHTSRREVAATRTELSATHEILTATTAERDGLRRRSVGMTAANASLQRELQNSMERAEEELTEKRRMQEEIASLKEKVEELERQQKEREAMPDSSLKSRLRG